MPFGSEGVEVGIGLALSGGGFRVTLFHCGVLWRLNELGYLYVFYTRLLAGETIRREAVYA